MKPVLKLVFKAKYSENPEPSGLNRFQSRENWFWNWLLTKRTRKRSLREMTVEHPGMFRPLRGRPYGTLKWGPKSQIKKFVDTFLPCLTRKRIFEAPNNCDDNGNSSMEAKKKRVECVAFLIVYGWKSLLSSFSIWPSGDRRLNSNGIFWFVATNFFLLEKPL